MSENGECEKNIDQIHDRMIALHGELNRKWLEETFNQLKTLYILHSSIANMGKKIERIRYDLSILAKINPVPRFSFKISETNMALKKPLVDNLEQIIKEKKNAEKQFLTIDKKLKKKLFYLHGHKTLDNKIIFISSDIEAVCKKELKPKGISVCKLLTETLLNFGPYASKNYSDASKNHSDTSKNHSVYGSYIIFVNYNDIIESIKQNEKAEEEREKKRKERSWK